MLRAGARALVAGLAGLLLALGVPSIGATASPGSGPRVPTGRTGPLMATTASPLALDLTTVSAPSLTPGSRYTLAGTLRNGGSTPIIGLTVQLRLDWARLDAEGIAAWTGQPDDGWGGTVWQTVQLTRPLAPGAAADFSLSGDSDYLGLPRGQDAFGPRGLAVEVTGDSGGGPQRLAMQRSFVVWDPGTEPAAPVRVAMIAPITPPVRPAETDAGQPGPRLTAEWAAGGRLARVLRASADPAIAWAIDPSLLTAAQVAQQAGQASAGAGGVDGATPGTATASPSSPSAIGTGAATPPPTQGPAPSTGPRATPTLPSGAALGAARTAAAWTSALVSGSAGRDVYSLPWGDPDLAALAHAKAIPLLSAGQDAALAASRATFGRPLDYTLAWPVSELADQTTLAMLARTQDRTVLLSRTALSPDTVPGRVAVPGARDDVTALVSDPQLAGAVAAMAGGDGVQPLVGAQRALAVLAAQSVAAGSAAEGGASSPDGPGVVAAIPRGWDPTRPDQMSQGLALLRSAPWIHVEQLGQARGRPPGPAPGGPRAPLDYPQQARAAELPAGHVSSVDTTYRRFLTFLPALHEPDPVFLPLRRMALSLVSQTWRTARPAASGDDAASSGPTPETLTAARSPLLNQVQGLFDGISVATGSAVNLLTQTGSLPVTVTSTLPYPVDLVLVLRPTSGRLVAGAPEPVFLAAAEAGTVRANALVGVDARANGDVDVIASLRAPGGTEPLVVATEPIRVRVRYDWENRGLLITAGVLGLLLLVGLVRGARRGTARIPLDSVPDPDDVGREPHTPAASRRTVLTPSHAPVREVLPSAAPVTVPAVARVSASASVPRGASGEGESGDRDGDGDERDGDADRRGRAGANAVVHTRRAPGPIGAADPSAHTDPTRRGGPGDPAAGGDPAAFGDPDAPSEPSTATGRGSSLLRSSAVMSAGTLVSRVLGLARVVVLSAAIGAAASGDAFNTANTLPNTLFILIGGGALNAVLVPQIVRAAQRPDGGAEYVDRLLTLAITVLGGATVVLTAAAPLLIRLYSKDWSEPKVALGTAFALWCLPQIFFYGLYTLYGQVLNARGSFGPYMWAPVINNVVAIAGMGVFIAMAGAGVRPVEAWSAGDIAVLAGTTTLGVVAQALVLVPVLRRSGYTWRPRWGWRGVGLREAGSVAAWTFAGVAIAQLGFVVISRVVNAAGDAAERAGIAGGRTVFDFAFLIFMLPHSLITVSVVTALFTRMSAAVAADRLDQVRADLSQTTRTVAVVTVFATATFVVLGQDLAYALFVGTDRSTTDQYAWVAMMMLIGLVPYSAQYLFQRVFYAFADARTPFMVGALGTGLWTVGALLAPLLVAPQRVAAMVGFALTVSTVVTVSVWLPLLRRRLGGLDAARIAGTHLRLLLAGGVAIGAGFGSRRVTVDVTGDSRTAAMLTVAVTGAVMVVAYLVMLRVLRIRELDAVLTPIRARLRRR